MLLLNASQHETRQQIKREEADTSSFPQQVTRQKIKREEVDDALSFRSPEDGTERKVKSEDPKLEEVEIEVIQAVTGNSYDRGRVFFRTKWRGDKKDSQENQDFLQRNAPNELAKYFHKRSAYRIYHPRDIFVFPLGSWDDDVKECTLWRNHQTGELRVDLRWKTGQLSEHDLKTVYVRCPQKVRAGME
ncbi:hypothetical protein CkaCkLH20_12832 [Colletotrichum karsti]|uniref:Chromo shadow domain-containing protein n=1 Tax=Colletotrichum karsti TaxID=1095194 RepID=A0A9P6HTH7_9PEZI|nr:uncharacterized protein CkaCkLH20_12832 [Colletotrichum karsti]KAF9869645.1 hypothetical protein CkaCkLH20_12832 [Colletotrichum karsti]